MGLFTKIIVGLIVLHLVVGFGWLMYKLSPKKGDQLLDDLESQGKNED